MSSSTSGRTINLPASLVEDLLRVQAGELQRLKKQLEEAQLGNTTISSELSGLVESTAKVISDLEQALTQSQSQSQSQSQGKAPAATPATPKSPLSSRSGQSTPSVFSFTSLHSNVSASEGYIELERLSTRSEAFTDADANFSSVASSFDVGRLDEFSDIGSDSFGGRVESNQGSEMSLMESLATRPLKPFSYKPWPQQYVKTLRQLGILTQPSFYPGDELIFNFADRRQVHLITVMYTTNNAQRTKKLHAWCEEFALKGWCGTLMMKYEEAWYYAGTYKTIGYTKITGAEFEALPEKTKRPARSGSTSGSGVKSQIRATTTSASTTSTKPSTTKKNSAASSSTPPGGKKLRTAAHATTSTDKEKENKSVSRKDPVQAHALPSLKDVQTQIADGRVELARITFSLVSWNEEIQKGLEGLDL
ncbi:hypothetical protein BT96DRAFT_923008 [Gymnopus androsaceus JB14]|uniref:DUF6697 domain-containing protein n=1 Tax=Gymnopus androsaceus JB14 TaxID=1447944 RepID=A0A6A4HD61_9AGAR|nr:hypothetical protein BT96DRAFT_923008 [Gymnopus androsaceus JB14]